MEASVLRVSPFTTEAGREKLLLLYAYNGKVTRDVKLLDGCKWSDTHGPGFTTNRSIGVLKSLLQLCERHELRIEYDEELLHELAAAKQKIISEKEAALVRDGKLDDVSDFFFERPPLTHQKIAFNFCRYLPEAAPLMDVGTGKTKVGIDYARWLKHTGEAKHFLVACPKSVKHTWVTELGIDAKDTWLRDEIMVLPGSARMSKRRLAMRGHEVSWVIVSYDSILQLIDSLEEWGVDLVIFDESSKIKAPNSQRSTATFALGKIAKKRMILTGTPVTQTPFDAWSQWRTLDLGETFGLSFHNFKARVAELDRYGRASYVSENELRWIHDEIYRKAIRFKLTDCAEMPPKTYVRREVEMTEEMRRLYEQVMYQLMAEFEGSVMTVPIILTKSLRLLQIVGGYFRTEDSETLRLKENPKLDALEELLDEILCNGHQVLIWAHFTWEREDIEILLKRKNIPYGHYGGSETNRNQIEDDFRAGKLKVFLGHTQTGGFGLNLQAATYVIYYSCNWSLDQRYQSEGRAWRKGQTKPVVIVDLVVPNSVDLLIRDSLRAKHNFAELIVEEVRHELFSNYVPSNVEPKVLRWTCPDCGWTSNPSWSGARCETCGRAVPRGEEE